MIEIPCLTSSLVHNYIPTGIVHKFYEKADTTDVNAEDIPTAILIEQKCSFCGHIKYESTPT